MTSIHQTAIVHPHAELGVDISVGPYAVIGPNVQIGDRTVIGSHVCITGFTKLGSDNKIFPFCSIGEIPQDKKYSGEDTRLEIGDRNTIREFCTLNCGTAQGGGLTRLEHDNWVMAYVHLAHDCHVGSHTTFANNSQLAGHVKVGDWAVLGGFTVVHQFVRIGAHSITAMGTILFQDVPPFVMAAGNPGIPRGINSEGLRRRGFSSSSILTVKRAFKTIYKSKLSLSEAIDRLKDATENDPSIAVLTAFLAESQRGIIRK